MSGQGRNHYPQFKVIMAKAAKQLVHDPIDNISYLCSYIKCLLCTRHVLCAFSRLVLKTTLLGKYNFRLNERKGPHMQCHCFMQVLISLFHQHFVCSSIYQELCFALEMKRWQEQY